MCQYQSLYYNNRIGYVIRCTHCNYFQIGYGTVIMNLITEDFQVFYQKIRSYMSGFNQQEQLSTFKSIVIPTPCEGLNLYLSEREVSELYQMLDEADSEWKIISLTNLISRSQ